jgi:hypothetical protein
MKREWQILSLALLVSVLLTHGSVAAERRLVPHLVAIQHNPGIPEWTDTFQRLEDEGAAALIRKPLKKDDEWVTRYFAIQGLQPDSNWHEEDYEEYGWFTEEAVIGRIRQTLQQNLGEQLTEERRAELALLVYNAMKSSSWSHAPDVQVVERGGVTTLGFVYWHRAPVDGPLVAKAVTGGDILLLGRFWVKEELFQSTPLVKQTIVLTEDEARNYPYYLAIIWREE